MIELLSLYAQQDALPIHVKWLGKQVYQACFERMRSFTEQRTKATDDEIWLVEHPPVYTLGQAGKREHLLAANEQIPLIQVDRGGQITYHGPGQVIAYLLVDLKRRQLKVKEFVFLIEQAVINTLLAFGLNTQRQLGAPGIYIAEGLHQGAKIAALGLKIKQGCSYHGVSLNVQMDLQPFLEINPCGYAGLKTIDLASMGINVNWHQVAERLSQQLILNIACVQANITMVK